MAVTCSPRTRSSILKAINQAVSRLYVEQGTTGEEAA